MASLKAIRKRIVSVRNTEQVTKAMKMVSAAKLRRAQLNAENARPYAEKLGVLLTRLGAEAGEGAHPFLGVGAAAPAHLLLISSDRGLCGAYNASLIRLAEEFLASDEGRGARLTVCGRRGHDHLRRRSANIETAHVNRVQGYDLGLAREVAADVSRRFIEGEAGGVYVVYSRFQSAISQQALVEKLLPVGAAGPGAGAAAEEHSGGEVVRSEYLYEPDSATILRSLLPRYLETKVLQVMLEATASEHGARMTAMDNASRNAAEMIDRLTLQMNRARQAGITTELMEIVSGAEALKG